MRIFTHTTHTHIRIHTCELHTHVRTHIHTHTNVNACSLAPGYAPLSGMAMARLVAEMRAVYRAAAMEQVAEARKEHRLVRVYF